MLVLLMVITINFLDYTVILYLGGPHSLQKGVGIVTNNIGTLPLDFSTKIDLIPINYKTLVFVFMYPSTV